MHVTINSRLYKLARLCIATTTGQHMHHSHGAKPNHQAMHYQHPSLGRETRPQIVPQPVVHVLSPRGIEYIFLTVALLSGALGFGGILLALVNVQFHFDVLAFPVAALFVSLPVFTWLFLRLKEAELLDPSLRFDASKRRSTQFIQIITFAICFFTLIGFVTAIVAAIGGQYDGPIAQLILNVFVIEAVAGGILAYYWRDEHQSR